MFYVGLVDDAGLVFCVKKDRGGYVYVQVLCIAAYVSVSVFVREREI